MMMSTLALPLLCLLPIIAATLGRQQSPPVPVVSSEYNSSISVTVNGSLTISGLASHSMQYQGFRVAFANSSALLQRFDQLQQYSLSEELEGGCVNTSLYTTDLFLTFDWLQAPGTKFIRQRTINGVQCNVFFNPFGLAFGKYACVTPEGAPVRFWLKLTALDFQIDYASDFQEVAFPADAFDVPAECPCCVGTEVPSGLADDFDSGRVASFWLPPDPKYFSYVREHVVVESALTRAGSHAANITVFPGDVANAGTEREELDLPMTRVEGKELYYGWSFLFPTDFELVDNRLVIGQWKQSSLFTQSPVFALRFRNGSLTATVRNLTMHATDDDIIKLPLDPRLELGVWHDVVFGFNFSQAVAAGSMKVWLNSTMVASFDGPTVAVGAGYMDFHMGLYRNAWPSPWTIYVDEFKVGPTLQSVAPGSAAARQH